MEKFTVLQGIVAPLDRSNVDTDANIPKQFLKSIYRTGYGPNLFDEWRYLDKGEPGMGSGHSQDQPGFRFEPASLSRFNHSVGPQKFRLRIFSRTRGLGSDAIRLQSGHCSELCRYFLQQCI